MIITSIKVVSKKNPHFYFLCYITMKCPTCGTLLVLARDQLQSGLLKKIRPGSMVDQNSLALLISSKNLEGWHQWQDPCWFVQGQFSGMPGK